MKKSIVALLLILTLLLGLTGCEERFPKVKDTFANGLNYGNTLAAEQGDYLVLRGGKEGVPGVFLYHKPSRKTQFIVSNDVYHIAFCDNVVYYKNLNNDCLYSYDLQTKEHRILLEVCLNYQVRDGVVYYLDDEHGNYLKTYDIANAAGGKLETSYTVDSFALTDYGMYYSDDTKGILMVLAWGAKMDRVVASQTGMIYRDVEAVDGADVVYLRVNNETAEATLCSYKAAKNQTTDLLTGAFDHHQYTNGYSVVIHDDTICAVNVADGTTENWGATDEDYAYVQIMSDCVIYYNETDEDSALKASIQYYPEKK